MDDKEQIIKLYHDMYAAMVAKDEAELVRVLDDSFVLIHMTGHSKVTATVFGGGQHTWRLALKFGVMKTSEGWKLTKASASTW